MVLLRSYCRTRFCAPVNSLPLGIFGCIQLKTCSKSCVLCRNRQKDKEKKDTRWLSRIPTNGVCFGGWAILSAAKSLHYVCGQLWGRIKASVDVSRSAPVQWMSLNLFSVRSLVRITMVCHWGFAKPHLQLFQTVLFTSIMNWRQHYIPQVST